MAEQFTIWELDKIKNMIAAQLEQYEQIGTLAIKDHKDMGLWAKFAQKVLRAYSIAKRIDTHCPECCRLKAFTVEEVSKGSCPKWWAIFDAEAEADCERAAARRDNRNLALLGGGALGVPGGD